MLTARNISRCLPKQLIWFVLLLWAFAASGQAAKAYAPTLSAGEARVSATAATFSKQNVILSTGEQQLCQDATPFALVISLQQAGIPVHLATFLAPVDEAIPPYAARAPGRSFLTRIFPTTIQPNAP